jgi:hypothetical protein
VVVPVDDSLIIDAALVPGENATVVSEQSAVPYPTKSLILVVWASVCGHVPVSAVVSVTSATLPPGTVGLGVVFEASKPVKTVAPPEPDEFNLIRKYFPGAMMVDLPDCKAVEIFTTCHNPVDELNTCNDQPAMSTLKLPRL